MMPSHGDWCPIQGEFNQMTMIKQLLTCPASYFVFRQECERDDSAEIVDKTYCQYSRSKQAAKLKKLRCASDLKLKRICSRVCVCGERQTDRELATFG